MSATSKIADRLAKTRQRVAARLAKAEDRVGTLEEQIEKLQAKLADAKAKVETVKTEGQALIAKQVAALAEAEQRESEARPTSPAGSIETEDGTVRNLDGAAVDVIKQVIGRRRKGILSPLHGPEAMKVLDALDRFGNVGETFEVRIRGRGTTILFSVEAEGLAFECLSLSIATH